MPAYQTKQKLQSRQPVFGTMLTECLSPEIVPALAACGLDFFIVDTEHSPADLHQIQALARASRPLGIAPLVRVTDNEYFLIARALDCGAAGVVIPRLQSAGDARRVVEAVKYSPLGRRGFFMRGILTDFGGISTAEGMARENQETIVVVQVETAEALADLENIVQVPGIDAIMIGPQDLSIALGVPGQIMHERMRDAFRRVAEVCGPSPVAPGIHMDDPALLAEFRERGFLFLDYSIDLGLLMKALRQGLEVIKGSPAKTDVQGAN